MTWYTAHYGSWNDPRGVQRIEGSFSYKNIHARAQEVADRTGLVVTIKAERGMKLRFETVHPQK